jgi:single-stranded-DNA-specific exonuclease
MRKIWHIPAGGHVPLQTLESLEQFLWQQRNLDEHAHQAFFMPKYERDIHDPFLLFGMREAVERVYHAITREERILVYGDYDADGVSSVAIMMNALQEIGAAVIPYLPHRIDDGYGINRNVLQGALAEFDLLMLSR